MERLFDSVLWNYYDFKSLRTNNHVERWHHRLNNDLKIMSNIHIFIYLFVQFKMIMLIIQQYHHVI